MEIRDARPSDLDPARKAMVGAYEQYAANLTDEAWAGYRSEIEDIEERAAYSNLIVGVEDGELIGAVTYYRPGAGGGYGDRWPDGWPSIRLLAVPPEHRGHGYGRTLTQACIDRARSQAAPGIALGTTEMMAVARAMYERMGFTHHPEYDFDPVPGITVFVYLLAF